MHDVLIVGCGPVGAILGNLLGKDGFDVLIIDEADGPYDKPRAINIDHEVLRVCQAFGLGDEVQEGTRPHTGTDFLGVDNQLIRVLNSVEPPFPLDWPPNLMFLQPRLEATLRKGLERYERVTLQTGHRLREISQTAEFVTATVEKLAAGTTSTVRARYAVGCDGATSLVRKSLGIAQSSLNFDESYIVVDILARPEALLPERTTHFCRPSGPGSFVVGPDNLRRVEMKILPDESFAAFHEAGNVRTKLAAFIDVDRVDVWRSAPYRFHALVADQWRVGRIILAGDAAHQMPPHLGQGLCSGVRDIGNLSWKLKMVLSGFSDDGLLDSYLTERHPHISTLVQLSKGIAAVTGELDVERARERDRRMQSEMESGAAVTVRQKLIPDLVAGLIDPEASPLAGQLSVQPRVHLNGNEAVRLDDVVGEKFAIIGLEADPREYLEPSVLATFGRIGCYVGSVGGCSVGGQGDGRTGLVESGHLFRHWMTQHDAKFVVVRPDKYVYGSARDANGLGRLCRCVAQSLRLTPTAFQPGRNANLSNKAGTP